MEGFEQCFPLYLQTIGASKKETSQKASLILIIAVSEVLAVFSSFQLLPSGTTHSREGDCYSSRGRSAMKAWVRLQCMLQCNVDIIWFISKKSKVRYL